MVEQINEQASTLLFHSIIENQRGEENNNMSSFQRSEVSFRRQGSSGLVWQDRLFFLGDLNQVKQEQEQPRELRQCQSD